MENISVNKFADAEKMDSGSRKKSTYKTLPKLRQMKNSSATSKLVGGQVRPSWHPNVH